MARPRSGSPSKQAGRFIACAAYTPEMVASKNDYHAGGLIAMVMCDNP
jgi:hypothetical protein